MSAFNTRGLVNSGVWKGWN